MADERTHWDVTPHLLDHQKHWDADRLCFTKKQAAAAFADALAPELNIRRQSIVVEGKKNEHHVRVAYTGDYWMPSGSWDTEFRRHKLAVRRAMDA